MDDVKSNNPHADDCGFALYGPPALCTCRAAMTERQPERVTWQTAARDAALEEAAVVAERACLVPPDGGSPTEGERQVAEAAATAIRTLKSKTVARGETT